MVGDLFWLLRLYRLYWLYYYLEIPMKVRSFFSLLKADKDLISGLYPKKYINRTKVKLLADKGMEYLGNDNYESLCTDFATAIPLNKISKSIFMV